jgi:hypothetical protein
MGGAASKIASDHLDVKNIVRRIDECILPDDREALLNFFELLEGKLTTLETKDETSEEFHNASGVKILLKLAKRLQRDEVGLRLIVGCFEQLTDNMEVIMDFIQWGGLEMLEKIITQHENDDFLKIMVPNLLKRVLAIGANAAIKEILQEGLQLRLCQRCQEVIERSNNISSSGKVLKIPSTAMRANRILMFMENYPSAKDVQVAGLDSIIVFARNADAPKVVHETKMVMLVCQSLKTFVEDRDVIWRACLALSLVADFQVEYAFEICLTGVHDLIAEHFDDFKGQYRVQQQILWLLASLLKWPRSKRRVHSSELCVGLFIKLRNLRDTLIKTKANSVEEKFAPFEIVAPIEIREFLRITGGTVVADVEPDAGKKEKKKFKKRKDTKGGPRFGTVEDQFKSGDKGLVDSGDEG